MAQIKINEVDRIVFKFSMFKAFDMENLVKVYRTFAKKKNLQTKTSITTNALKIRLSRMKKILSYQDLLEMFKDIFNTTPEKFLAERGIYPTNQKNLETK